MCCLPNQFPLPIFLIVNLKHDNVLNSSMNYESIKEICENNMFFKFFIIDLKEKFYDINEEKNVLFNYLENSNIPFFEMIDLIMKFKDIKENILLEYIKVKQNRRQIALTDQNMLDSKSKDKKKCLIL